MEALPPPQEITINAEESDKRLKLIRRDWKWAAASDFLYKFNPMLHLDFLDLAVSLSRLDSIFSIISASQRVLCVGAIVSTSRSSSFDSRHAYTGRRA